LKALSADLKPSVTYIEIKSEGIKRRIDKEFINKIFIWLLGLKVFVKFNFIRRIL